MNWHNELQTLSEHVAESPKTVAIASSFSTAAGLLTVAQILTGFAAGLAVFAGLACTLVLIRLNLLKIRNEQMTLQLLRKRAAENGVDLEED